MQVGATAAVAAVEGRERERRRSWMRMAAAGCSASKCHLAAVTLTGAAAVDVTAAAAARPPGASFRQPPLRIAPSCGPHVAAAAALRALLVTAADAAATGVDEDGMAVDVAVVVDVESCFLQFLPVPLLLRRCFRLGACRPCAPAVAAGCV